MDKPEVLALNQTIAWGGKLEPRKIFRKEQIIELVRQLQQEQRDADIIWFKRWLYSQAIKDSKTKTGQTKAYELYQRLERLLETEEVSHDKSSS